LFKYVGIQPDLLVPDPKADIIWHVCVRFDAQKPAIEFLCRGQIFDGINELFNAIHLFNPSNLLSEDDDRILEIIELIESIFFGE